MIYWIQAAALAGVQEGADLSLSSVILSGGIAGAVASLVGVLSAPWLQTRRHNETLQQTQTSHNQTLQETARKHNETLEQTQTSHNQTLEQTQKRHSETLEQTANLEDQRAHEAALQKYFEQVG